MSEPRISGSSINGLYFAISSEEFSDRLKKRSEYHAMRAEKKEKEDLPQLQKLLESIESGAAAGGGKFSNYSHNPKDSIDQLKEDIRNHRNKSVRLKFLSEHVLADSSYILSLSDVDSLEVAYI